jgi:hypothetical protein
MKSRKALGALIIILILMVKFSTVPTVRAASETQTINIANTLDDGYITEAGIGIDGILVAMLDPGMDIRSYFIFEDIKINFWESLDNATLRLTSSQTLDFDADSSVTVYGMRAKLGANGTDTVLSTAQILSTPFTSSFVNVNTSQFQGGATIDINVTEIVNELKNNPNWEGDGLLNTSTGDDMGFIIVGAPDEGRFCYDYLGDPARSADLIIGWGADPTPPAAGGEYNETYRDMNVWVIDHNGPNRTGEGFDLDWNEINMSDLTEIDSGAAMTLNNDTWVTLSAFQAQQHNSFYNDSGAANIDTAIIRGAINVSAVTNNLGAGADRVMAVAGLSTATPVGGGGLGEGGVGDWVGLMLYLHADDQQWRFRLAERSGAALAFAPPGPYKTEGDGSIYYFEFVFYDSGAQNYLIYREYLDPEFESLINLEVYTLTIAAGPMRYPQVSSSLAFGNSFVNDAEFYTFDDFTLARNETWIVTYPNGTQIGNATSYEDIIVFIDDYLGPDPEDPAPPSQGWDETGPFTRFNVRFYILALGLGLFWGPLMVFAYKRPTGYEFVIGAFIMLVGAAFMISAGSV